MSDKRLQLSMYVPAESAAEIEALRGILDPVQSRLIPAHVTLCRDDELTDLKSVQERLRNIAFGPLTLRFGKPIEFGGHGVLLECIDGEDRFRALREYLLASENIRDHRPHITLAHPRNPKTQANPLNTSSTLPEEIAITFPNIYLIEQEIGRPWRILERYDLLPQRH